MVFGLVHQAVVAVAHFVMGEELFADSRNECFIRFQMHLLCIGFAGFHGKLVDDFPGNLHYFFAAEFFCKGLQEGGDHESFNLSADKAGDIGYGCDFL